MSWPEVSKTLSAIGGPYRSVDLRIAAIKKENWVPVVSSVAFSCETPAKVSSLQAQIHRRIKKYLRKDFTFFLETYPYEDFQGLAQAFAEGRIEIGEEVLQGEPVDILRLATLPSPLYVQTDEWTTLGAERSLPGVAGGVNAFLAELQNQRGTARILGYDEEFQMISDVLRMRDFSGGSTRYVVLRIPIYAKISSLNAQSDKLTITVTRHSRIRDLQLNFSAMDPAIRLGYYEVGWRVIKRLPSVQNAKDEFKNEMITIRFGSRQVDLANVALIQRLVPIFDIGQSRVVVPPRKPSEPLTIALSQFCPLDVMRAHLLNPEKFGDKSVKAGRIFENAEAWLLALHGYSVIRLEGRTEQLRVPGTNYEIGALDMIAQKPRKLFLIDCDTSVPDSKKISAMTRTRGYLSSTLPKQDPFTLVAVLFTPTESGQPDDVGVSIADKSTISQLFDKALRGKVVELEDHLAQHWY